MRERPVFSDAGDAWPSIRAAAKALGRAPNTVFGAIHSGHRCNGRRLAGVPFGGRGRVFCPHCRKAFVPEGGR